MRGDLKILTLTYAKFCANEAEIVAAFLRVDDTLEWVNLSWSNIGPGETWAIADAMKHNKTVQCLDLAGNDIGDEGAQALLDALNYNVCLTWLNVEYNNNTVAPESEAIIQYLTETRNTSFIPAAIRRASLYLIAIRRTANPHGMGTIGIFPKDIVKLIAMEVFATRKDPIWIEAAENTASAVRYKTWSEDWTKSDSK